MCAFTIISTTTIKTENQTWLKIKQIGVTNKIQFQVTLTSYRRTVRK